MLKMGLLSVAIVAAVAGPAFAQIRPVPAASHDEALHAPRWMSHVGFLGVNSLVGALTAGIMQHLRGGSFQDGFTRGALGGAVVYAGKRIGAERFGGAGVIGREVAAVGTSIVRNAADARPSLQRLVFPLGPVNIYVRTGPATDIRAKINLTTLVWSAYGLIEPRLELELGQTLSSGAPVFRARDLVIELGGELVTGIESGGAILLSDDPRRGGAHTFAHERMHVVQYDQLLYTWFDPAEDWLLERVPGGQAIGGFVDFGIHPLGLLNYLLNDYDQRPWEFEAEFLSSDDARTPQDAP